MRKFKQHSNFLVGKYKFINNHLATWTFFKYLQIPPCQTVEKKHGSTLSSAFCPQNSHSNPIRSYWRNIYPSKQAPHRRKKRKFYMFLVVSLCKRIELVYFSYVQRMCQFPWPFLPVSSEMTATKTSWAWLGI